MIRLKSILKDFRLYEADEADRYVHVGYGKYKEKDSRTGEALPNSPTYLKKDNGGFEMVDDDDPRLKKGDDKKDDKPDTKKGMDIDASGGFDDGDEKDYGDTRNAQHFSDEPEGGDSSSAGPDPDMKGDPSEIEQAITSAGDIADKYGIESDPAGNEQGLNRANIGAGGEYEGDNQLTISHDDGQYHVGIQGEDAMQGPIGYMSFDSKEEMESALDRILGNEKIKNALKKGDSLEGMKDEIESLGKGKDDEPTHAEIIQYIEDEGYGGDAIGPDGNPTPEAYEDAKEELMAMKKKNEIKVINGVKYKAIKEAGTKSIDGEELMNFLMKRFKYSKKQAIATMKKHKMDTSFLKKESVKEEKKSKKHKLQETYERIANRMVT